MRKLERLNVLLNCTKLDLPSHRRTVDSSGRNLKWLRENIEKRNTVPMELSFLLSLDITQLHENV